MTTAFHALHREGLLILPNAWDAGSAALMASVGARAVATTSAGLCWALGWPDGDALPVERLVVAAADVARGAGGLPVSIDMEGGYSDDPEAVAALAVRLVEAGAQGINIEDGGRDPHLLAAKIAAIRVRVADRLFINARCDVWLAGLSPEDPVREAVRRAELYVQAGAEGFFAPGVTDAGQTAALVKGMRMPLNVMARPELPEAAELKRLGVRRLSAGSGLAEAGWGRVAGLAKQFLADGRSEPMIEGAMSWSQLNAIMPGDAR